MGAGIFYSSLVEINFLFFLFFTAFLFFFSSLTNFRLLLNSELFWMILYVMAVILSLFFDDMYILTLSLFFLMLSASEISIGLVFLNNQVRLGFSMVTSFDC